jgi:hypothetical protein
MTNELIYHIKNETFYASDEGIEFVTECTIEAFEATH